MKKIVLSLALVSASFAFAQKKEIQNASKAIEKNDIAAAKAEISKAEGLYKNPLHPYTKALLSAIPIPVVGEKKNRIVLEGDVPSPIHKPTGCPFHTRCREAIDICSSVVPTIKDIDSDHKVACHLYN